MASSEIETLETPQGVVFILQNFTTDEVVWLANSLPKHRIRWKCFRQHCDLVLTRHVAW